MSQVETVLSSLIRQRQALDEQIHAERSKNKSAAVSNIKSLMRDYGVTLADLRDGRSKRSAPSSPKYRDPVSGKTWTGRGRQPQWIEGQDRDQFLIAA